MQEAILMGTMKWRVKPRQKALRCGFEMRRNVNFLQKPAPKIVNQGIRSYSSRHANQAQLSYARNLAIGQCQM